MALIHADDRHHVACREALNKIREPLGTVWPAVTEAMYLLGFSSKAQDALWRLLEGEAVKILPLESDDMPRMRERAASFLWLLDADAKDVVRFLGEN